MWRGLWLLLLPAPAFALSPAFQTLLPTLAEGGATIAGMMLLFHASIAGIKMLHVNFASDQEITDGPAIQDFTKYSPVTTDEQWAQMTTHLDFGVEGDGGASEQALQQSEYHDPGLRFDHIELNDEFESGSGHDWEQ